MHLNDYSSNNTLQTFSVNLGKFKFLFFEKCWLYFLKFYNHLEFRIRYTTCMKMKYLNTRKCRCKSMYVKIQWIIVLASIYCILKAKKHRNNAMIMLRFNNYLMARTQLTCFVFIFALTNINKCLLHYHETTKINSVDTV